MRVESILKSDRAEMWLRIGLVIMTVLSVFAFVQSAGAAGAMQIDGIGYFDIEDVCNSAAEGADFALVLEGDLEGCLYTWVESSQCRPSGTYIEKGREKFVGLGPDGEEGSFETTFVFTGKFDDCENLTGQIWGRCQHPIETGSGTGAFEDVKGRLDFKDDVEAGIAVYRGHLK